MGIGLSIIKTVGSFSSIVLAVFVAGVMFLFVVALLLTATFLGVSCARELWDIYLAEVFEKMRESIRKRTKEEGKC